MFNTTDDAHGFLVTSTIVLFELAVIAAVVAKLIAII